MIRQAPSRHQDELFELASLFSLEQLDVSLALSLLSQTIDLIVPDVSDQAHRFDTRNILSRLVNASRRLPAETMDVLATMIHKDASGILLVLGRDEIRTAVERAYKSRKPNSASHAKQVANLLVSRGYLEYRDFAV